MPQLNTLVLKDGAATPADHTFQPRDVSGGVATLVESTGTPIGDRRITLSTSRTAQGRVKPTMKFVLPVVQETEVGGVSRPAVIRTAYVDVQFSFDATSSLQDRKDAVALVRNILADDQTMVRGALIDLAGIY